MPAEVLAQRRDLLLLEPQADDLARLAGLEVEDPLAGLADGAGGEVVGFGEVERGAHDSTRVVQVVAGGVDGQHRRARPARTRWR